eukprot:6701855-Prymnesium_polylepis.1
MRAKPGGEATLCARGRARRAPAGGGARGHAAYPFSSQRQRHGLRGARSGSWLCTLRGLQLRLLRADGRMEIARLHAADRSPFVRAAHSVRAYNPALQSRWPTASR